MLNSDIPAGYFSVFCEMAEAVVTLIENGCEIDSKTVPDISVGSTWATYWQRHQLDKQFGERIPHGHIYPEWYPQAKANPVRAWVYPNAALPAFRQWLLEIYYRDKLPKYVTGKVKSGAIPDYSGKLVIESLQKRGLPQKG